jgi:hypothetical protein
MLRCGRQRSSGVEQATAPRGPLIRDKRITGMPRFAPWMFGIIKIISFFHRQEPMQNTGP